MILHQYTNGNAHVAIYSDGTRIIDAPDDIQLEYPLNIDVRLSRQCAYGRNPTNGKSVCGFCHESATTDGRHASITDINALIDSLYGLPKGTEIAVGINQYSDEVEYFLKRFYDSGWIVNATVNQGFLKRDLDSIQANIRSGHIKGLGVSYRKHAADFPSELLGYQNTVFHVIAGIDSIKEVAALADKGVKKILVLGEKDFGFNLGKVKLVSESHREWYRRVHELFKKFDIVSFDNLALEQLTIKRFIKNWDEIYQHEFSFYANAVDRTFSPSSRSADVSQFLPVKEYFARLFDTMHV